MCFVGVVVVLGGICLCCFGRWRQAQAWVVIVNGDFTGMLMGIWYGGLLMGLVKLLDLPWGQIRIGILNNSLNQEWGTN